MFDSHYSIIEPIVFTAARLEVISNRYLFGPMEMTISSVKILRLLDRKGGLTPKKILEEVGGTKSNITQRLNILEKRNYIKRNHKKTFDDKRKIFIELSPAGKEKIIELCKHLKKVKLEFESNFSKKEIEQHFVFFEKLNKLIETKNAEFLNRECKKY